MNRLVLILLLAVLLSACGGGAVPQPDRAAPTLTVGDGVTQKSYTPADLQELASAEAVFKDVTYKGVPLKNLLAHAGVAVQAIRAVKVIASDGYTMNYDPSLFQREDVLVSFARADGPLAAEDGSFRMVIPRAEGKLNVRMLVEVRGMP